MRRISPGTVTVGVIAIVLGLATAYVVRRSFDKPSVEPPAGVPVVVSRANIPHRERIRPDFLEVVQMAKKSVPKGALSNPDVAANRTAMKTITAGQPITQNMLFPIGHMLSSISSKLEAGYRAVTIEVDGTVSHRRFISPDTLVDISVTVAGEHPDLGSDFIRRIGTTTLLQSVKVLAVVSTGEPARRGTVAAVMELIVQVIPEDAKRLILAQRIGSLSVTVVGPTSTVASPDDDNLDSLVNPDELLGLKVPQRQEPYTVEVYRGGRRSILTFGSSSQQWRRAQSRSQGARDTSPDGAQVPQEESAEDDLELREENESTSQVRWWEPLDRDSSHNL